MMFISTMDEEESLCNEILKLDDSIRFAALANDMGKVLGAKFRPGVQALLTKEEIEDNIIKAVLRMKTREDYEQKLGKTIYTFSLYDKVKRVSIALNQENYSLLMVSFEVEADHEAIILQKLLPQLKHRKLIA
jgi:hypothetical protein